MPKITARASWALSFSTVLLFLLLSILFFSTKLCFISLLEKYMITWNCIMIKLDVWKYLMTPICGVAFEESLPLVSCSTDLVYYKLWVCFFYLICCCKHFLHPLFKMVGLLWLYLFIVMIYYISLCFSMFDFFSHIQVPFLFSETSILRRFL